MANFWNGFLNQLGTGDQIRDYQHAARTFVDGLYRLSPKVGTLFHVFVDVNPTVAQLAQTEQIEIGLMAKQVNLPKFNVQHKIYNAYNRKNIAQERINYDPLTITFHDDSADIVRQFWYGYYAYYYRDADHQEPLYHQEHKYKKRQEQTWGFSPLTPNGGGTPNYINSIRIYSLHQKSFSSYILIRPTITSFAHGEHIAGEYTPMEHTMTMVYEAVQYEKGQVSNGTVLGFSEIHYDQTPSPLTSLGGGTRSILGPGGLIEGTSDVITNLQNGNFIQAGLGGARTFNNFKNADLKSIASGELLQTTRNIIRGQNPLSSVFVPTAATVNEGIAKSVSAIPGLGRIVSGTNMNTQNNQVIPSNQGTPN